MITGNLNLSVCTESQRAVWLLLPLFPVFIIFFIGSIAETNRAPFDLAEAIRLNYSIIAPAFNYTTAKFIKFTMFISIHICNYILNIINFLICCFYGLQSGLNELCQTGSLRLILIRRIWIEKYLNTRKQYISTGAERPNNKVLLHPEWITGFTDGEGSFMIKISKAKGYKLGWKIQPVFQIKLNIRDLDILYRIKEYFGDAGIISFEKNLAKLNISKLSDILDKVIPHFLTYPLLTKKYADFQLFRQIILIIKEEPSLSIDGFIKILNLRYYLNNGISEELKKLYPDLVPVSRPEVPERAIHPEWLVGFVDGEGSFNVITVEKRSTLDPELFSCKVWLHFQITQHSRDTLLMERIVTYLDCGSVKKRNTDAVDFKLNKFEILNDIIIPFFQKYPLQSSKLLDFQSFVEAADIIKSKSSRVWSEEQFNKIKNIQNTMNKYIK